MHGTTSQVLSSFVSSLEFNALPAAVIAQAKYLLLDALGLALTAARRGVNGAALEVVAEQGGKAEATVLGRAARLPAANAALVNGMNIHAFDFDDTHFPSVAHPSASIASSALAVGESRKASGRQLIVGLIAGWEGMIRLVTAGPPGCYRQRGFFSTAACASFGVSLAAGKIMGLSPEKLAAALGICGAQAGGITEFMQSGGDVKRFYPAWAAHAGIYAALMAEKGLSGPLSVFDGKDGFLNVFLGPAGYDLKNVTGDLHARWETLKIQVKPYPCNFYTHPYIDCALDLRRQSGLPAEEIESLHCWVAPGQARRICEPSWEAKKRPASEYDARFSLPFCAAAAFTRGEVSIDSFEEGLTDPEVMALAQKVEYEVDPGTAFPRLNHGRMRLRARNGRTFEASSVRQEGEGGAREEDVLRKFRGNCRGVLPEDRVEKLIRTVLAMEEHPVAAIIALCIP